MLQDGRSPNLLAALARPLPARPFRSSTRTIQQYEINVKVYGNIRTATPWAALSLGISAFRTMCLDFPGLRWRAFLECPQVDARNTHKK